MTRTRRALETVDAETLAVNAFKEEGAFLHQARAAADTLERRLRATDPTVRHFVLTRDELSALSGQFSRSVAISVEYHLGYAELPAA